MVKQRARKGMAAPHINYLRKALKGISYKRGRKETRGRKKIYSKRWVKKLNATRKRLIKEAKNEREVGWQDVRKKARAPSGHRSTMKRSFEREGIPVAARRPRQKPDRTALQAKQRVDYCDEWGEKPGSFFTQKVDLIHDVKNFDIPTTEKARRYLAQQRVRFHLRTPSEGTLPQCTKPGRKKNRMNTGAKAHVCAGISNGRIVLWHYLPKKWNGEEAAKLYRGPIKTTLVKHRGLKRKYRVFEDNDPTGYKSNKALVAKEELGIEAVPMPTYSPDLNPLDFSIWDRIEALMVKKAPKRVETVEEYKRRLRRTALGLPQSYVSKCVLSMPKRMRLVSEAKGYSIKAD